MKKENKKKMYLISVEDHFSSAHQLREYQGKCENVHGHNWKIKAILASTKLDSLGMVLDFTILKQVLKEITNVLDHKMINDVPPFDKINPSAENIAFWIYQQMCLEIEDKYPNIKVYQIDVWESEKSCASYLANR